MFQKYKYVLTVYQERSITKAAKRLFISQPSLSVAIHNIEKQIGMPLFERRGSLMKPTETGAAYVTAAQKIYNAEEEFKRRLMEISGLQTGKLVVAGSNYLSSGILPQIISRFRTQHPGIELVLTEANSVHLKEMLMNEEVDIVIDNFGVDSGNYELYPLANEQIVLCVPAGNAVNQTLKKFQITPESVYNGEGNTDHTPPIDISLFENERFILLKPENDMFDRAMNIFESHRISPNIVFQVDQLNIAYALTESGLGTCFLTDTFFKYRKRMADVVLYKLQHQLANRILHIGYKKGRYCTCAMSEFIKIAQELLENR